MGTCSADLQRQTDDDNDCFVGQIHISDLRSNNLVTIKQAQSYATQKLWATLLLRGGVWHTLYARATTSTNKLLILGAGPTDADRRKGCDRQAPSTGQLCFVILNVRASSYNFSSQVISLQKRDTMSIQKTRRQEQNLSKLEAQLFKANKRWDNFFYF